MSKSRKNQGSGRPSRRPRRSSNKQPPKAGAGKHLPAPKGNEQALQLPLPPEIASIVDQALAFAEAKQFSRAMQRMRQADKLAPRNSSLIVAKALIMEEQDNFEKAISLMWKAIQSDPDKDHLFDFLAHHARRRVLPPDKTLEMIDLCRQAMALRPDHLEMKATVAFLMVQSEKHKLDEAEEIVEAVLERDPEQPIALTTLGIIRFHQYRYDEGESLLERARCELHGIGTGLIKIRIAQGKLEEAVEQCKHWIERHPNEAAYYHLLMELLPDSQISEHWLEKIEALLERNPDPVLTRNTYYLKGVMHEKNKRWDEAFRYYSYGNECYENHFSLEMFHRSLKMQAACFDREFLSLAPKGDAECETPIFLVGTPRSGSTLTEQILSAHPQVQAAGENNCLGTCWHHLTQKVLGESYESFTVRDLQRMDKEMVQETALEYLDAIRKKVPADAPRITDKTLGNYRFLGLIEMLFPKAKIIHCRRHPLGSCFSCYKTHFSHSDDSLNFTTDLISLGKYYHAYHQMMDYWKKELSIPIFEVVYEDTVQSLESVSRRLLDFCGLPWDDCCLEFFNNTRPAITASEIQVKRPIYLGSVDKWKHFEQHMNPLKCHIADILETWEKNPPKSGIINADGWGEQPAINNVPSSDHSDSSPGSEKPTKQEPNAMKKHSSRQQKSKASANKKAKNRRKRRSKQTDVQENSSPRFNMHAPRSIAPLLETAVKLSRSDKREEAYQLVEKAMDKMPKDSTPWICKAIIQDEEDKLVEAIGSMYEAAKRAPGNDSVFNFFSDLMRRRILTAQEMEKILDLCKQAAEYHPTHAEFLGSLAFMIMHVNDRDREAAEDYVERALAIDPEQSFAITALGALRFHQGRYEEAEELMAQTSDEIYLSKRIQIQIRIAERRFEEAKTMAAASIEKHPDISLFYNFFLDLASKEEITLEWANRIHKQLENENLHLQERRDFHFLLSKIYEKHGKSKEAFGHLKLGNDLYPNTFDMVSHRYGYQRMHYFFHPKSRKEVPASRYETDQPIFIIGMPRSGSTLLEQVLSSHHQIEGIGEAGFLSKIWREHFAGRYSIFQPEVMTAIDQETIDQAAAEYLEKARTIAPNAKIITDKTLNNYRYLGLLQYMLPKARVIHCRRHPLGTCYSCFKNNFAQSEGDLNYTTDLSKLGQCYLAYHEFMETFQHHHSLPMFQVVYEEMVENLEGITRRLLDFLGLPWDPNCLDFYKNTRAAITASQIQVKRPIYQSSIDKWKRYEPYMSPLMHQIGDIVQKWESHPPKSGLVEKSDAELPEELFRDDKGSSQSFAISMNGEEVKQTFEKKPQVDEVSAKKEESDEADFTVQTHPDFVPKLQQAHQLAAGEQFSTALDLLQECLKKAPDDPALWLAKGDILILAERMEEGFDCFLEMLRKSSRPEVFIPIFVDRALSQNSGFRERTVVVDICRRAIRMFPDHPDLTSALACILADAPQIEKIEEAEFLAQKVFEKHPHHVLAQVAKGKTLFYRNRLEEAETALHRAIDLGCDRCAPHLYLVRCAIARGDLEKAKEICLDYLRNHPQQSVMYMKLMELLPTEQDLALLEGIEEEIKKNTSPLVKKQFYFLQGRLHEKRKHWETAFDYYLRGNALYKKTFDLREEALALQDMHQMFPPDLFLKEKNSGLQTGEPIFVVGMPRSGSTLTEQILSSHPDIAGAGEIGNLSRTCDALFDETIRQTGGLDFSALGAETLASFAENYMEDIRSLTSPEAKAIVNKALGNFKYLGFIALLFPKAKIIHCRRHPMDTCFSCFKTDFAHSMTTYNYTTDLSLLGHYYGLYHQMMEYWKQVLPIPFFEVVYEEMVADQESITRQMLDFCGMPWHPACLEFHQNPRVAATASEVQVKQPIYRGSVGKWKHFLRQMQPTLAPLRNLVRRWELQRPKSGIQLSRLANHLLQKNPSKEIVMNAPVDPPAEKVPPAPHMLMPLTIDTFTMEATSPPVGPEGK